MLLGAHTAGVPVVPLSTAYSLLSRDHERVRAIAAVHARAWSSPTTAPRSAPALEAVADAVPARGRRPRPPARHARARRPRGDRAARPTSSARSRRSARTRSRRSCSPRARPASPKGVDQHAPDAVLQPAGARRRCGRSCATSRRCSSTGCRGATRSAATTTSARCSPSAARCTSTTASPVPALFDRTVAALREVAPTVYYNVPAGWALLAAAPRGRPRAGRDVLLAAAVHVLRRGGAAAGALGPPPRARRRGRATARSRSPPRGARPRPRRPRRRRTSRRRACGVHRRPAAGRDAQARAGRRPLELRLRGPNVTPGYHRDPAATAAAFDEEGFYRSGDAARLVDPDDPPGPALRRPPGRELQAR